MAVKITLDDGAINVTVIIANSVIFDLAREYLIDNGYPPNVVNEHLRNQSLSV
jgi:hypothetical protein